MNEPPIPDPPEIENIRQVVASSREQIASGGLPWYPEHIVDDVETLLAELDRRGAELAELRPLKARVTQLRDNWARRYVSAAATELSRALDGTVDQMLDVDSDLTARPINVVPGEDDGLIDTALPLGVVVPLTDSAGTP